MKINKNIWKRNMCVFIDSFIFTRSYSFIYVDVGFSLSNSFLLFAIYLFGILENFFGEYINCQMHLTHKFL